MDKIKLLIERYAINNKIAEYDLKDRVKTYTVPVVATPNPPERYDPTVRFPNGIAFIYNVRAISAFAPFAKITSGSNEIPIYPINFANEIDQPQALTPFDQNFTIVPAIPIAFDIYQVSYLVLFPKMKQ